MNKAEQAKENFLKGYNCAQAVLLAFADDLDLDKETALKISSSFGAGMGGLREVCGAVSAMFKVIGLKYGYSDPKNHEHKKKLYSLIQEAAQKFKDENGSIVCAELLGLKENCQTPEKRTKEYYKKRPCQELVYSAAKIVSEEY
ncbi:MAG: C-GCAxxG-C-C family protein [Endomicrobia bacterium]|nr:C-GCAxxG-C-C family protein [Endomicrobiia bacterium]MCL2506683.1 C-GCAxxG-C-C family protein [Endomicrobiia bacterium]